MQCANCVFCKLNLSFDYEYIYIYSDTTVDIFTLECKPRTDKYEYFAFTKYE